MKIVALHHGIIIAGHERAGGGPPIEVRYPYTGERVGWLTGASAQTLDTAIAGALAAYERFQSVPARRRSTLLDVVATLMVDRQDDLARQITLETGKTIQEARLECDRAVSIFRRAAEEALRIGGEIVPLDGFPGGEKSLGEIRRFPIGPVAAITPFNSPLEIAAHKVATALAAGNSVLLKPASSAPLSALNLGRLVLEANREHDLPSGIISVVPTTREDAETLITDPRVRALFFTGSSSVGWALRAKAAQKKVALQLGGNGAVIVHQDADLEDAATRCAEGGFRLAGQSSGSVQRVYVHESVADRFIRVLVQRAEEFVAGDPLDEDTRMGPMLNAREAERAETWIREAVEEGAQVLCGGGRNGALFEPTVVTNTGAHMRIVCDEVFAPVIVVDRYDSIDAAVAAVNATEYGLQAGVFSRDLGVVYAAYAGLEMGGVIVNDVSGWRVESVPYGGVKSSGYGREGIRDSIREMTEPKLLVLNRLSEGAE